MPDSQTRLRIVETSLELFYRHGFHAVGLDRVLKDVALTKTTFYKYFDSKDDLIVAAIEHRDAWWRKTFAEQIREIGGDDPVEQLRAVFSVLKTWFSSDGFYGCLFINAASAFPARHEPAHCAASANIEAIREIIAGLAGEAGAADPQSFAEQFNLIIEGAIVTEVIDRASSAADTAARLADLLIRSALPS